MQLEHINIIYMRVIKTMGGRSGNLWDDATLSTRWCWPFFTRDAIGSVPMLSEIFSIQTNLNCEKKYGERIFQLKQQQQWKRAEHCCRERGLNDNAEAPLSLCALSSSQCPALISSIDKYKYKSGTAPLFRRASLPAVWTPSFLRTRREFWIVRTGDCISARFAIQFNFHILLAARTFSCWQRRADKVVNRTLISCFCSRQKCSRGKEKGTKHFNALDDALSPYRIINLSCWYWIRDCHPAPFLCQF